MAILIQQNILLEFTESYSQRSTKKYIPPLLTFLSGLAFDVLTVWLAKDPEQRCFRSLPLAS
ncbi:MAG: hypothetical protein F6K65_10290 [Moorea sp. SIO3C2]|nr:hypothetical protein [Moorena sp. SIO3C2]